MDYEPSTLTTLNFKFQPFPERGCSNEFVSKSYKNTFYTLKKYNFNSGEPCIPTFAKQATCCTLRHLVSMSFGLKFEVPWETKGPKKAGFGDMALAVGFVFDSCLSSWAKVSKFWYIKSVTLLFGVSVFVSELLASFTFNIIQ